MIFFNWSIFDEVKAYKNLPYFWATLYEISKMKILASIEDD